MDRARPPRGKPQPVRRRARLTERDHELLVFLSDHRLILADHAQALLGISHRRACARLLALTDQGLVARERIFHQQSGCYQVTSRGLAAAGSHLPRPRIDLREYLHDVGLAWLWLAARRGAFGPVAEVLSERQLRSRDGLPRDGPSLAVPGAADERYGVRLGGFGPRGREQLHYPDLQLRTADGRRLAIELELTAKGARRREKILSGYGTARNIDGVIYLTNRPAVTRSITASVSKLHLGHRVQVRPFTWTESMRRLERHLSAGRAAPVVRVAESARSRAASP